MIIDPTMFTMSMIFLAAASIVSSINCTICLNAVCKKHTEIFLGVSDKDMPQMENKVEDTKQKIEVNK
jgi:hypothetical protein